MRRQRLTYQPGTSLLHQLHPLVKVSWLVFLTVFVFIAPSYGWVLAVMLLSWIALPWIGVPLSNVRGMRLFLSTAILLAVLQIVFNDQGLVLLELGPITITREGLLAGIYIGARFLSIILLSYIFVVSTSPNDLAYGLMQAGLPYRFGFALVTALRFVPIFESEATMIYQAQLVRGVQYDRRNLRRWLEFARQFILPMLVSVLHKVDHLAVSMEGRSFGRYPKRTYYHPLSTNRKDWIAVALLGLSILAVILI